MEGRGRMMCYLCGSKYARVSVTSTYDQTYFVCRICDERGVFCERCERPIPSGEDKYELRGAYDSPTGEYECHGCAESRSDAYHESMVF
jgi:hypothetical protein